ncbi:helix-turn-helix domain-containing protein [Anaeromicrobium sediminis]|uniref:helix-turn-helix domain-containing protein n=1 Tax=Anaeromicrobium sediminis TaxID=1478221 RepID=UPI0015957B88|nr:MerR family transcriptional regulator [Anaeromicrobium sediminis]
MRKYLTIGELADLMKISTSNIRYYEKEGLLSPCKIHDNGYRLYDFNELDTLETILLLRKLDVPLKQLKTIMKNYSIDDYIKILNSSLSSIDSRIDELHSKRRHVTRKLNYVENFKKVKRHYHITHIPERVLYCLHTGKIFEYTIKETYELIKSQNLDYLDTYQDSYIIPLDYDTFSFCILKIPGMEAFERFPEITLPGGSYLSYGIFVQDYDEIHIEVDKFYDYMKKNSLSPIGKLIIIENTRCSHFHLNSIYLELQILIN